jgi:threonine aldolase
LLCGDAATIDTAHRYRKMLGGGMRQAGILAAAGLYALDHHIERLRDDHRRARLFREGIEGTPGIAIPLPSPTNMVYVEVEDAPAYAERLAALGVLVYATGPRRVRTVFHLDVNDEDVAVAVEAFQAALNR